ncbi:CU044_5270 family protein [Streptomyces sp. NPDC052114]|uniref:CU044_5270 family protein n=1 Tax=unclassified Streptomyces TaxID=2593676 RepID=UPI0034159A9C
MTERTDHRDLDDFDALDVLDFPGAAELIAAGEVAPPAAGTVAAAQAAVAHAAARQGALPGAAPRETAPAVARERSAAAPHAPPRARAVPRRRRLLVAAAAVAAIAAGAVTYPVLGLGGEPAATASASRFLDDMAAVAADAPAARAPYWKVRVETENQDDGRRTDTTYVDREGRVWSVDADGTVHEPPAGAKGKLKKWPVGGKWLTWPEIDELPTDRKTLAALFDKDPAHRFQQVVIMLEDSPAGPELRAALFRILADTPGMKLIGDVKDSTGRPGVAVQIEQKSRISTKPQGTIEYWTKDRYVVDPDTGLLLEQTHKIRGDHPTDRYTWLEVGPADRVG